MLMFSSQPNQVSLEDLANDFCDRNDRGISKQAIQERFNDHAVAFMESLLKKQLSSQLPLADHFACSHFNRVRVKDSTRYCLPEKFASVFKGHGGSGSPAQISIQYEYDMKTGQAIHLDLTSACRNDQQDSKETLDDIEEGDLLIRDLGYATQAYIKHIRDKKAYYLNRLNARWAIFDEEGKPIDFAQLLKKIKKHSLDWIEINIQIRMGNELVTSRLVVSAVDQNTYEKRIQKVKKENAKRGCQTSEAYKTSAALNLFITNIPQAWLAADQVRATYGLRWQIELVFKVWKSQIHINKVKPTKIQRFRCELIARLLWVLFNWQAFRFTQQHMNVKCSVWKFYKAAIRLSDQLRQVLLEKMAVEKWLALIAKKANEKYRTEIKKGKQNYANILMTLLA